MNRATRRQLIGVAGLVLLAGAVAVLFSPAAVLDWIESLASEPLVFAGVLVGLYLVRPFLLWPVSSVAVLLGYLYGPGVGFILAILGAAVTALPPYLLGRYVQNDIGLFGQVGDVGAQFFETVGDFRGVIAARFSPIPGDPISYGAGLSRVSAVPFFAGTMIGEIPWAVVAVFAGASMRTFRVSEFTVVPELVVALTALAVLLLAGPLYRTLTERLSSGS